VGVKKYQNLAGGTRGPKIACIGHPNTFRPAHAYAPVVTDDVEKAVSTAICRTIVNDDDFKVRVGSVLQDTTDRIHQILALVESRDNNSDSIHPPGHFLVFPRNKSRA